MYMKLETVVDWRKIQDHLFFLVIFAVDVLSASHSQRFVPEVNKSVTKASFIKSRRASCNFHDFRGRFCESGSAILRNRSISAQFSIL